MLTLNQQSRILFSPLLGCSILDLYILHKGTDRLEHVFGDCQTLDHARNFDVQQLPEKLSIATLVNSIMEHNPDLDKGHHRLSLQNAMGIYYVDPKSWKGKVCVGDVNLKQQWDKGRNKAENILQTFYRYEFKFERNCPNLSMIFSGQEDVMWEYRQYQMMHSLNKNAQLLC